MTVGGKMTDDILLCINSLSVFLVNLAIVSQGVMQKEAHALMNLAGFFS